MGQIFWRYTNDKSVLYDISVYHGDQSGHVLIYCGYKIITIDFAVKRDKDYSFLIDDELFSLKIIYEGKKPTYRLFNQDTMKVIDVFTLNDGRTKSRKYVMYGLLMGFLILVVLMISLSIIY